MTQAFGRCRNHQVLVAILAMALPWGSSAGVVAGGHPAVVELLAPETDAQLTTDAVRIV